MANRQSINNEKMIAFSISFWLWKHIIFVTKLSSANAFFREFLAKERECVTNLHKSSGAWSIAPDSI